MAAIDTGKGYDCVCFDFNGDLIPDELATSSDTGTITCNVGLSGNKAEAASILRLDNSNQGDNEMAEVDFGALYYRGQCGHMWMEARVAMRDASESAVNVGFNDDTLEGSNTLPVELSTTTFTANATTWIGFVYDADATNDNWHAFYVDDDTKAATPIATLNSGVAGADSRWYTLRIDVWDRGSGNQCRARWFVQDENGNRWEYVENATIDRDAALVPHVAIECRSGSDNIELDIDYIEAARARE